MKQTDKLQSTQQSAHYLIYCHSVVTSKQEAS